MNTRTPEAAARAEYQRHFTAAVDALVAAVRTGVTDGGELVSHLLATVAANLGGLHLLTEARPGSWEADYVDQMLTSTVGQDGEFLLEYRTHPIEVVECVEVVLAAAGIAEVYDDTLALVDAVDGAAYDDGDQAAVGRVDQAERLVSELREADVATYRHEYQRQVRAAAEDLVRTRHLPADVPVTVRWVAWQQHEQITHDRETWGTVEHTLAEQARKATLLPGFHAPVDWSYGEPVDQLRAAGRLPHQRIAALAHYARPPAPDRPDSEGDR